MVRATHTRSTQSDEKFDEPKRRIGGFPEVKFFAAAGLSVAFADDGFIFTEVTTQ